MGFDLLVMIIIATVPPIVSALALAFVAVKTGFGRVNQEVREERGALVTTLRHRMDVLETENQELKQENKDLRRKVDSLEATVDRLEQKLLQLALDERLGK